MLGLGTAALLLHHLGVGESARYVTALSLVAIPVAVADVGLGIGASRELALPSRSERRALIANILGQRLAMFPPAVLLVVGFAVVAGYPVRMVYGAALAGAGALLATIGNALLAARAAEPVMAIVGGTPSVPPERCCGSRSARCCLSRSRRSGAERCSRSAASGI